MRSSAMDAREIYTAHAERYDELVRAEDTGGRLLPAIESVAALQDRRVIEVGAGTGRVTRLLLQAGAEVVATEPAAAMLEVARARLGAQERLRLVLADASALPVSEGWADVGIAAWVFGHFRHWLPDGWQFRIGAALDELARATKPGGALIIIETLGTGRTEPAPPNPDLAEYYRWLEHERGFVRQEIRTDYAFASVDEAARVLGFFFGDEKARLVRERGWSTVPECTGVWSRLR
jgi:ubiquinone/menaquinone biosynthesis C-methylase UbiE